jgi:hypothetical protein
VDCIDDEHCGALCEDCTVSDLICSLDGTDCVQCIDELDCDVGEICDAAGMCDACDTDELCGDSCMDCTATGGICNENWGICVVPSCSGEDDFTPCETLTADPTDRSYDICLDKVCVSPGCGDGTCNTPGPHFTLADTGQRDCYNATATMTCTTFPCGSDGSPAFCGQDAQYGWDATHTADLRFTRDLSVLGQPVVADNVTGLIWQGCAYGLTGDSCTGGSATSTGWAAQLVNCDGLDWGGHTDWRLPDEYQLQSLVDYGKATGPGVDTAAFPNTPNNYFWSSSVRAADTSYAWYVSFFGGNVGGNGKSNAYYARCVRGGPWPQPARFTRDTSTTNQPTVLDNRTGLEWQGCARGLTGDMCGTGGATTLTWQAALDYCEELDWGGDTDWRLPNIDELKSITDNRRTTAPLIDATAFPATPSSYFWSSSSRASYTPGAWLVGFSSGSVDNVDKT